MNTFSDIVLLQLLCCRPETLGGRIAQGAAIVSATAAAGLAWLLGRLIATGEMRTAALAIAISAALLVASFVCADRLGNHLGWHRILGIGALINYHTREGLSVCTLASALLSGPATLVVSLLGLACALYGLGASWRGALCAWCRRTKVCRR